MHHNKYDHFDDHEEQDDQGGTHFEPDYCVPESWGAFDTNSSGVVLVFANPDHMALVIEAEVLPTAPPAAPPVVASGEGGEVATIPVALPEGLACSLHHDKLRILNVGLLDWDALANIFHQRESHFKNCLEGMVILGVARIWGGREVPCGGFISDSAIVTKNLSVT